MDEEMIVVEEIKDDGAINTEIIEQEIEQDETVEYIEVGESEEIEIMIDETMGYAGAGDGNYAPLDHTHPINQIEKLNDTLHNLASSKEYHSTNSGFAEFRQWKPNGYYIDNLTATGGVGYFVSLVKGTGSIYGDTYVDICQNKNDDGSISVADVYGVTVADSGFYGYQSADYDSLDSKSTDKSDDPDYAKVCLLGNVKVRVSDEMLDTIKIGDFVVPNELGYATKSDNNIGFKVISKGTIEKGWNYVSIALVPQNDNISRVMKELESTRAGLGDVTLELGNMGNKVDDIFNTSVNVSNKVDGLEDILNETTVKVDEQVKISQEVSEKAEEIAKETKETMNTVASQYSETLNKANEAKNAVDDVLGDVKDLKDDMRPLAQWKGNDGSEGIVGFVAQTEKDRIQLATLTSAFGANGSDITAIIQKIDENGAAIQHLVSHVDKYVLGEYSPAYGLSYDETTIIKPGTVYVPTKTHIEKYDIEDGEPISMTLANSVCYEWAIGDTPDVYTWVRGKRVSRGTTLENVVAEKDGDLWYCWQGIYSGDRLLYDPGTLYLWDDSKKLWIAVASINDNSTSRIVGLVSQTADKLRSAYKDLEGNVSTLEQTVNGISTTVQNEIKKEISTINQTAEEIMMGIYNPDGSSSFGLLLDGITSNSINTNVVKIKTVAHAPAKDVTKYDNAPTWNGEMFVPVGSPSNSGKYYFDPNGKTPYTYFCYVVDDEHYEVYGINNITMASLNSRVTNHDAMYEEYTRFKSDTSDTFTSISQKSDANEAKIASVAAGEYVVCTNVNLEPTEEDKAMFTTEKHNNMPTWDGKKFVFDDDASENGVYCIIDTNGSCYYKLLCDNQNNITGYEKYELASSGSASIVQRVEENKSSIGMVVDSNGVKAYAIVEAINDSESKVSIKANKINFDGFTTFANTSDLNAVRDSAIAKVEVQYSLSDSMTTPPTNGWSITAPHWESNKYMWQKTVITYANGTIQDGVATCISGAKGADGTGVSIKGTAYINGSVSDDIIGQSFELYSDAGHSTQITNASDGDAYLVDGYLFVYSGTDQKFTCTGKIQGPAGNDGHDGINGKNGTSIIWKGSYSEHLSTPQNGWAYYNSTDKASYVYQDGAWYQMSADGIDGQKGADGSSITWKGESSNAPSNPLKNWVYRDKDDGRVYIYNGTAWELMVLDGDDGINGTNGSDGLSVFITYNDNISMPTTPTGDGTSNGWHTDATSYSIWMSQKVAADAASGTWGEPIKIKGMDGKGISEVKEYYKLNNDSTTAPTSGWEEGIKSPTKDEKYLWNYEKTIYTNGDFKETTPVIIATYTEDGRSVGDVKNYYLVSSQSEGITKEGYDWSDISIITNETDKYLWNYEEIIDTEGKIISTTDPCIIGVHGETGNDGISITKVIPQYYLSSSKTMCKDGEWKYEEPTWTKGKYIWTRSEITWENGNITYTDPTLASALNSANETADNAQDTANDASSKINSVVCIENNTTYIDGAKIYTGSVTADKLVANILKSENYEEGTGVFSTKGTFFNLADGSITSKNFAIDNKGNATIAGKITATSGYIGDGTNGFTIAKLNDCYSLSNHQDLYSGNYKDGKPTFENGVYIGPDGIGLGNGAFYVDDKGSVVMQGNITLGGVITWDMQNSPVKSRYSSIYDPEVDDPDDEVLWHTVFKTGDKYMQISFDGGQTWNTPTKIVGEDGKDGSNGLDGINGSDANVTSETVFNALTEDGKIQGLFGTDDGFGNLALYINAEYIRAGTLSGMKFADTKGAGYFTMDDDGFASLSIYDSSDNLVFNVKDNEGSVTLENPSGAFLSSGSTRTVAQGDWQFGTFANPTIVDFSYATVKGINITAVFA